MTSGTDLNATDENNNDRSCEFGVVGTEEADESHYLQVVDENGHVDDDDSTDHRRLVFPQDELYGRQEEMNRLLEFYEQNHNAVAGCCEGGDQDTTNPSRIRQGTKSALAKMMLVAGISGSGKTRLVEESLKKYCRKPQRENSGGFKPQQACIIFHGKYNELQAEQHQDPYKCLAQALSHGLSNLMKNQQVNNGPNRLDEMIQKHMSKEDRILMAKLVKTVADTASKSKEETQTFPWLLLDEEQGENRGTENDLKSDTATNPTMIQSAVRAFLQCLARFAMEHSVLLVLFLDDLQWADAPTLQVLRSILKQQPQQHDGEQVGGGFSDDDLLPNFCMVGSYRSDEVGDDHALASLFPDYSLSENDETQEPLMLERIDLEGLSMQDLGRFIAETLEHDEINHVMPLAQAIYLQTRGNIFHTMQAMEQLVRDRSLYFDRISFAWQWIPEAIEISDRDSECTIQAMVVSNIATMPIPLQKVLAAASKIRSTKFTMETLAALCCLQENDECDVTFFFGRITRDDLDRLLDQAVREGFLIRHDAATFSFGHDQIQQAAESFLQPPNHVTEDEHCRAMLHIGWNLHKQGFLITAARHLNNIPAKYYENDTERESMARLNLQAARASVDVAAFKLAAQYADLGLSFLPASWNLCRHESAHTNDELRFHLGLDLSLVAAQSHQQIGDVSKMENYCRVILSQNDALNDSIQHYKFQALFTKAMGLFYSTNRYEEARSIILNLLAQSGCPFPKSSLAKQLHSVPMLLNLVRSKRKWASQPLNDMRIMTNSQTIKQMKLLYALFVICYLMNDTDNLTLLILYGLRYTRKFGVSIYSPRLVAMVSVLFSGGFRDLQGAALYANYALRLHQKVNHRPIVASTMLTGYAYGLCWTLPIRDTTYAFKTGIVTGEEVGDFENSTWCALQYLICRFQAGANLVALDAEFAHRIELMERYKWITQSLFTEAWWKIVRVLTGQDNLRSSLRMDAETMDTSQMKLAKLFDQSAERIGLLYMGDFEKCAELARKDDDGWQKASAGHFGCCLDAWASALSYVAAAQHCPGNFRHRRAAKQKRATINRWVRQGNPNVKHWKPFLDAEHASLKQSRNKHDTVIKHYKSAVDMALKGGFVQDAALANERWGLYLLNIFGDQQGSSIRIREAMRLFREWGASGKVERMREQYPQLLKLEKDDGLKDF